MPAEEVGGLSSMPSSRLEISRDRVRAQAKTDSCRARRPVPGTTFTKILSQRRFQESGATEQRLSVKISSGEEDTGEEDQQQAWEQEG